MKKKIKIFLIALFAFFTLTLTGCTTSFCSAQDQANIKSELRIMLDEDRGTGDYTQPDAAKLTKAGITTAYLQKQGIDVASDFTITWEYLGTLDAEKEDLVKNAYVDYLYKTVHPKACLVSEDHEDQYSGATIEKKTFGYAVKQGLLEILAWPVSWLFVKGAELLGGGTLTGATICISIILVTFLIRGIVLLCTLKSTKQQQEMQAIQGEINTINMKYAGKNDQESRNRKAMETMALYKKHGINPGKSLIQPFLTLPIFIAVYSAVKDTTVIFEQSLFGLSLGAKLGNSIIHGKWIAIVIFILMGAAQFLTMKLPQWLAIKNAKVYDKEKLKGQQGANNMTYIFLIMIVVIAWMLPVAMSIYWVASSLFTVLQSLVINFFKNRKKGRA